jgi:hypothetical protein
VKRLLDSDWWKRKEGGGRESLKPRKACAFEKELTPLLSVTLTAVGDRGIGDKGPGEPSVGGQRRGLRYCLALMEEA